MYLRLPSRILTALLALASTPIVAQPPPSALTAFDTYISTVESRLARQHSSSNTFLAPADPANLRRGDLIVENLTFNTKLPGALLHHWRGTAFVPGATADDLERLLHDFPTYPQHFAPQVLHASILAQHGDRLQATMRVRQRHILTVVMDTAYDITFTQLDPHRGCSISRSTRIAEIDSPGTPAERPLTSAEDHGFLWRQNTYWSWEERDGGLYIQVESISLSRSIPHGLAWAVQPFVESVPRESLEFTLNCTRKALHK